MSTRFDALVGSPLGSFALNQVSRGLRVLRSPINPHRMINAALSRGIEDVIADPRLSRCRRARDEWVFQCRVAGRHVRDARRRRPAGRCAHPFRGDGTQGLRDPERPTRPGHRDDHAVAAWLPSAADINKQFPRGYGHFGFGGSGAFADPGHDLALAMVCNRGQGTPIGDLRILRLSQATARAVKSLD